MPKTALTVPHGLGQDAAIERLKNFIPRIKHAFADKVSDLEESWEANVLSFSFKTFGMSIKGKMAVEEEKVDFNGELPFAAMMFKGKIEDSIRTELDKLLA